MKICRECGLDKPLEEYHRDKYFSCGYKARCKSCKSNSRKNYYENNKQKELTNSRKYLKVAPEPILNKRLARKRIQSREYYYETIEWQRIRSRIYRQANLEKSRFRTAKRRALQRQAIPGWASEKYISIFYQMAKNEQVRIGRKVDVDHIVPINSDLVCGLHCEDNLQLLFKEENVSKGNRTWPNMWE